MGQEARCQAVAKGASWSFLSLLSPLRAEIHHQLLPSLPSILRAGVPCHAALSHRPSTDPQESNDFERFKIQLAKRSRRDVVRKAYVKEKKASA